MDNSFNCSITDTVQEAAKLFRRNKYDDNEQFVPVVGERIGDYTMLGLYKLFFVLAGDVYKEKITSLDTSKKHQTVFNLFNQRLIEFCNEDFYKIIEKPKNDVLTIQEDLFDGMFLSESEYTEAKSLVREFMNAFNKMYCINNKEQPTYFRYDDAKNYLDSYLNLCRFIFRPHCLQQDELRSLKIIEKMLNIGYDIKKRYFTLYSPYVVFAILRAINYIIALPDDIDQSYVSANCAELLNRRKHIIATYAIRSFSRFTILEGKSCVVEYSRRKDKIVCKNLESVSSVENVKPIRLLEKITSYIYEHFTERELTNSCSFKFSIYGFCSYENEGVFNPAEIDDLVYEIFSWFEDKRSSDKKLSDKHIENIQIDYYTVDETATNKTEHNVKPKQACVYKYFENNGETQHCSLNIFSCGSQKYNKEHISHVLCASNLVFFLDCPWLATEDFSLINEGNLRSYLQWIEQATYEVDLMPSHNNGAYHVNDFFDRMNLFASINDQFNRLAVDNVLKYGKVVRIMKDYMLKWIQDQIELYKIDGIYKTVYIYNSSLRGLTFSDYADYPIIREESYSNKRFNIMRFSTRENYPVSIKNSNCVYVSLWNLVKYVDISFVYIGLKHFFSKFLFEGIKESNSEDVQKTIMNRDIISIMRNIVFAIEYSRDRTGQINRININVILSKPVRNAYKKSVILKTNFKRSVNEIIDFFTNIIVDIIFKNSNGLGDDCIRDAFERCLYNQAKTVDDIFFLHSYTIKRNRRTLANFVVNVFTGDLDKDDDNVDAIVPNFDSFSDKRAYQKLFKYLDMPNCPELSINSLLSQVDRIFSDDCKSQSHSKDILLNVKNICEKFNYTESFLYENLNLFQV